MKHPDTTHLREGLQTRLPDALAWLKRMVSINSFTENIAGVNAVGELTAECFEPLGFTPEFHDSAHPSHGRHLVLKRPGAIQKPVLLVTHLDTVFPEEEEQRNRFHWQESPGEGRIYGPGTVDIKGGTALLWLMLHGLREFFPEVWESTSFMIAANSSEEAIGAEFGSLVSAQCPGGARAVLVFEGGPRVNEAFHVVTSRKGRAEYRFDARGIAAHAGSAHPQGINAILGLSRALQSAHTLTDYTQALTLNVGKISGGTVINRVPHEASAELEIRAFDPRILANACAAVEGLQTALDREKSAPEIAVRCIGQSPAWPPHPLSEQLFALWHRTGNQHGMRVENTARGGLSDANYLWQLGPTLDGLGPSGANAHCSERSGDGSRVPEFVEIDSFVPKAFLNVLSMARFLDPAEPACDGTL